MLALLLLACSAPPTDGVVRLQTRDGVALVADLWVATPRRPGIVLLHMTPTGNFDRHDWPLPFVELLRARDWNVIAVDRRGGGESEGVAREAFTGEFGRYDVEACVLELQRNDLAELAIVGASNGTTSMIDYAAWARSEDLPVPAALGFMTGGDYTENNTAMGDMPRAAAVFTFSTVEREWSALQAVDAPDTWEFREYADGAHGTRMFDAAPEVAADLDAFLAGVLP